jgi:hypothetical protein
VRLRRLVDLSRQWHALDLAAGGTLDADMDGLCWPRILPQPWQHGTTTVVELASSGQLVAEGVRMRHCVASFDQACHRGRSAIVSLRSEPEGIMSTAELRLCDDDGLYVEVGQHGSVQNSLPGRHHEEVLAALVQHLNSPDLAGYLRARRDFQDLQQLEAGQHAAKLSSYREQRAGQGRELAWRLASDIPGAAPLE